MKFCTAFFLLISTSVIFAGPGLTIYNQDFAVVRDTINLDLKAGVNEVHYEEATRLLEPDSVILRQTTGKNIQVLEQNYRNDPVSQGLLLSLFEGQTVDFLVRNSDGSPKTIQGKIIRSGYLPGDGRPFAANEAVISVDGKIQFGLPGQPIFPSLGDDTILKPRLSWKINAARDIKQEAELGYITGGLSWQASYNLVAPEEGNTLDIVGWITISNLSGKEFRDASIKLMAGDVNKLSPAPAPMARAARQNLAADFAMEKQVTQKSFDEYHLYSLARETTLKDQETKQVEFIRASGVPSEVLYIYDGASLRPEEWRGADASYRRTNAEFGAQSQTKVAILRQFTNSQANGLGIPLPKGRVRFYRTDGRQIEFIGENSIDHTPANELVKIYTGDAFDLLGERKRTDFQIDTSKRWIRESFAIILKNRKKVPVTIRVVEPLYRGNNWSITAKSADFEKAHSDEIVFPIEVKADSEQTLTYTVEYSW